MPMQIRSMPTGSMLIAGARQLLTLAGPAGPRRRSQMRQLGLVEDGAVLVRDGLVMATGRTADIVRMPEARDAQVIDGSDKVVMPAFVDSHTHLVFGAPRLNDFEMRISGAKYEEIAKAGGGIASSVRTTRAASTQDLTAQAIYFAQQALATETTTLEVKSGYGLNAETEIRILEVIRDAGQASSAELIPTFLGAHVVPWDMPLGGVLIRRLPDRAFYHCLARITSASELAAKRRLRELCRRLRPRTRERRRRSEPCGACRCASATAHRRKRCPGKRQPRSC